MYRHQLVDRDQPAVAVGGALGVGVSLVVDPDRWVAFLVVGWPELYPVAVSPPFDGGLVAHQLAGYFAQA